ncbi:MAG: response regulator [Nitrospirae bacterium]|nr:response regulator [Nitrospirota bacterium]
MDGKEYGNVLVVDDNPTVLEVVSLTLKEFGYNTVSCLSAQEAENRFTNVKPDVVLTDIVMPGESGIDLLEKIHASDPEMPVILMTGYADLDKAIEAIKKGAFDFIIKPYKPEQLRHSVERAVKYYRLIRMEKDYKYILQDLNQALETLVAERTMSVMALTLADRVRNPATVIGWTCKRLLEKEEVSGDLKESLKNIIGETEKLESIVKDFQGLLKNRQSMYGYEDINAILSTVLSVIDKEAGHKGVTLEAKLAGEPLKINTHKNLVRVALFHLMRNAVEATPEGGKISVMTGRENNHVALTISDTGKGISPDDLGKIFEPFFSTKEHRFGMGLPLVKQIISEHAGEITVRSEVGKGTEFRMVFPSRWSEGK